MSPFVQGIHNLQWVRFLTLALAILLISCTERVALRNAAFWHEVDSWAKSQTPSDALFLIPSSAYKSRNFSSRRSIVSPGVSEVRSSTLDEWIDLQKSAIRSGASIAVVGESSKMPWPRCYGNGGYTVYALKPEGCPGDWKFWRHDRRNTAYSSGIGNLAQPPQVLARYFIGGQSLNREGTWTGIIPELGQVIIYLSNGRAILRLTNGKECWRTPWLGVNQLIGISDLDGNGTQAVIVSAVERSTPGHLYVLEAKTGHIVYEYHFQGNEFGLERRRTTIASLDGGKSQAIIGVQTYSARVWAFDFSAGINYGRVMWRSPKMHYHSPDPAPLVTDIDGDGNLEVLVDSAGQLYVLDSQTGLFKANLKYQDTFTFGGIFTAADLDDEGDPDVVRISNSVYLKDLTVFENDQGKLKIRWQRTLETRIENNNTTFVVFPHLVDVNNDGKLEIVTSIGEASATDDKHRLLVWDAWSGKIVHEVEGIRLNTVIQTLDGRKIIIGQQGSTLLVLADIGNGCIETIGQFSNTRVVVPHNFLAQRLLFVIQTEGDTSHLLALSLLQPNWLKPIWHISLAKGENAVVLSDDAETFYVVSPTNGHTKVFDPQGKEIGGFTVPGGGGVPLVSDIDRDGKAELIIVNSVSKLIALTYDHGQLSEKWHRTGILPSPREGYFMPLIADLDGNSYESIVVTERYLYNQDRLVVLDHTGQTQWYHHLYADGSEPEYSVGHFSPNGVLDVFFKDSKRYLALDGRQGTSLWSREITTSECQRTPAVMDINNDGFDDILFKASTKSYAVDGSNGSCIWTKEEPLAYGGHTAAGFSRNKSGEFEYYAVELGAGAVGMYDLVNGPMKPAQQVGKFGEESLPPALADTDGDGSQEVAQIDGNGVLRVFKRDGSLIFEKGYGEPVSWGVIGGDIDGDGRPEFLFATKSGKLYAVNGEDGSIIWVHHFEEPTGMPILADVNRDGCLEIVISVYDGYLYVLGNPDGLCRSPDPQALSPSIPSTSGGIQTPSLPRPQVVLNQEIGDWRLLGYDVDEEKLARDETVDITLYWYSAIEAGINPSPDYWVQVIPSARNLIKDGGFEIGSGYQSFPKDIYSAPAEAKRFVMDIRMGQPNTVALLENSSIAPRSSFVSAGIPVDKNKLYLQSCWLRAEGGGSGFFGRQWLPEGSYNYVAAIVSPDKWTHYAELIQPPTGSTESNLWLLNFNSTGKVYFDNVIFVELGEVNPTPCRWIESANRVVCNPPLLPARKD